MTAPASANPIDLPAATLQNSIDQANAAVHFAAYAAESSTTSADSPGNVTCSKPVVYGVEVIPHVDAIFAEARQTDQAVATATCANLTGETFSPSLEIAIEYCVRITILTCSFARTGYGDTFGATPVSGVAVLRANLLVAYPHTHDAVGKVRRVFACVRVDGRAGCQTYDYSGTYGV